MMKSQILGKFSIVSTLSFVVWLGISTSQATPPQTQMTWAGHAAFEIKTPKGKIIWIDPWVTNPMNPWSAKQKNPMNEIKKADYILLTHGHSDHVGDSLAIAKKTGAQLITNFELGNNLVTVLGFPKNQAGIQNLINPGGQIEIADGEVQVNMVPAVHSSGLENPKSHELIYGGVAAGFVLKIKDGPSIYHSGDTAYFKDMELIGETQAPDVALLNIGGHFGMSPEMAARAASAVHAKLAIPHHFKTFPILTQSADSFVQALRLTGIQSRVMTPGMTLTFENNRLQGEAQE